MTMKVKQKEPRIPEAVPLQRVQKAQVSKYDESGGELMDPTPIAPPLGYKKSPTIAEQIRTMIQGERLRQEAEAAGYESFEEADDFEVGDDFDPRSPYEEVFEPMPEDDGFGRLKELGDHIGDRIISALGGDASSPAPPAEGSGDSLPGKTPEPTPSPAPGRVSGAGAPGGISVPPSTAKSASKTPPKP